MTDIVDRLLGWHDDFVVTETPQSAADIYKIMCEAAEEIERLQAEVVALHEQTAALQSKEVCTVPHSDEELDVFCVYCKLRDARDEAMQLSAALCREERLRAELKEARRLLRHSGRLLALWLEDEITLVSQARATRETSAFLAKHKEQP